MRICAIFKSCLLSHFVNRTHRGTAVLFSVSWEVDSKIFASVLFTYHITCSVTQILYSIWISNGFYS